MQNWINSKSPKAPGSTEKAPANRNRQQLRTSLRTRARNGTESSMVGMQVAARPASPPPSEVMAPLRRARVVAGLSQADLARRVGEKKNVIRDYENGSGMPDLTMIVKLERALNCRLPRPAPQN